MQSLGMRLRQERERQKLSLQKIGEDTCISARYLEAIEADDLSSLPGEFFYRAFVRQYSGYLGFDSEAIDRDINVVSSKPVVEEGVPTGSIVKEDPQIHALRETLRDKPLRPAQEDGMSKAWMVFAGLVIVACLSYFGWQNWTPGTPGKTPEASTAKASSAMTAQVETPPTPQPPALTPSQEAVPTESKPGESATPNPPTPSPTTSEVPGKGQTYTESVAPQAAALLKASAPANPGAGQFSLTLVAKEMTWIRITADGLKVFGGTIDAGQQRTVLAKDAEVIVGNAGTLDVIYNGKPLQYGNKGEVKTLLFKPEGWKYKPKPVPVADPNGATTTGSSTTGS